VDIEAESVALAFGPRDDVGGAQQVGIGDAGQRTASSPVIEKSASKEVLADAPHNKAFGFGRARKLPGSFLEGLQRYGRQADAEFVDAVESLVKLLQAGEGVGRKAKA